MLPIQLSVKCILHVYWGGWSLLHTCYTPTPHLSNKSGLGGGGGILELLYLSGRYLLNHLTFYSQNLLWWSQMHDLEKLGCY